VFWRAQHHTDSRRTAGVQQGTVVGGRSTLLQVNKTLLHVQSITFTRLTRCGGGGLVGNPVERGPCTCKGTGRKRKRQEAQRLEKTAVCRCSTTMVERGCRQHAVHMKTV
jgi:hypothetical protein